MTQQEPPPWIAASSGAGADAGSAYNWEHAESLRAKKMAWSPWRVRPELPNAIPPIMLTGGIPDPDSLPVEDLIECNERVLRREGMFALQYGGPQGYPGLREWLLRDINRREGLDLKAENFVLTCGSSGGLENLVEALLNPGDVAIVERPCYPGSTRVIMSCLAGIEGVTVDADGIDCDELDRIVERVTADGKTPKLLYTIANFQNPAASTLTIERRQRVIEICRRNNILIIQDDAYGAITFGREPLPSLFALAGGDGAVLLGTFSKTLATGLRIGWIMAAQNIVDAVTRMRFDMGVSPWGSRVIADFCESGKYDEHVPRMIEIYRGKRDLMLSSLEERCAKFARWNVPAGGFFVWLELSEGVDPVALDQATLEEGVGYVGGKAFFDNGDGANYARLCYSNVAENEIPEAIMRFGRALERASAL
ncbi:MAG: PLP-dependent aminotransferase family protein [Dehalococcoidia bacterium]